MNSIINKIVATEVIVPANEGYVDRPAFGPSIFDKVSKWIFEVSTQDGLIGYGETLRGTSEADLNYCTHQILGKDLFSLSYREPISPNFSADDMFGHADPPIKPRLYEVDFTKGGIAYGLEIAILDLWGKRIGLPLHALLGGAHRDGVPTGWWLGRSDPEHAAHQAEIGVKFGFNAFKIKAAAEDDIPGIVRAIKKVAGSKTYIAIDPNNRFYSITEALKIAYALEEFENIVFEDPFPFEASQWNLFRQKCRIPLALHAGDYLVPAIKHDACDILNISCWHWWRFLGDAHFAWRNRIPIWTGSGLDLGVLDAYALHISACARTCTMPGDTIGHRIRCDDLVEEPFVVRDGSIQVPKGPGLGVTLDRKALKKFGKRQLEFKI